MKRILFASVVSLGLWTIAAPAVHADNARPARKPNLVIIVADDLGHADIGCQGIAKDIKTPNIDSIATAGIRFTQSYVSGPVCSPTRAGLMTGRYQQRFGFEQNPTPAGHEIFGMPADQVLLPELLKRSGYATGMVGKWHLGARDGQQPNRRGFDEFFGFRGGAHRYVHNEQPAVDDPNAIRRNDQPVGEPEYLTDAFNREAVAFVERHHAEPFFLYLAYNAPHVPQAAPDKYLARFPDVTDPKRKLMLAMMSAEDDGVGQVLAKLREHHLEDDTLVVFFSDNGGPLGNGTNNAPFRGRKGHTLEGGIRVPFMLQWPGHLPAGKVDDRVVIQLDVFPTLLSAAGAAVPAEPKLDGANLLPYLAPGGNPATIHDTLYWRFGPRAAIRSGNLKLQWHENEQPHLFDLAKDPGESTDLASTRPDDAKRLLAAYKEWDSQLMKPLWPGKLEGDVNDGDEDPGTKPAQRRPRRAKS